MSRIHDALKKAEQERTSSGFDAEIPPASGAPEAPVFSTAEPPDRIEPPAGRALLQTLHGTGNAAGDGLLTECAGAVWRPDPRDLLFAQPGARPLGAEEFRTLRTRLTQMREKLPLQAVLVTSALPGEGKTFVSANLAQAFAQQNGRRVLLLDGDLRLPRLHALLGAEQSPGLSEFLRAEVEPQEIVQRNTSDNLFFIPAGQVPSDPIELLGNGRLKGLLHRLAPLFDWIVLDSPPCVPLSDASLLADLCDGVLLVVRAGKTPFDVAQKGSRELRERRLLGVVLNQVAPQTAYSSYYYSSSVPGPAEGRKKG
jgi:protein-tyrosine kinase